MGGVRFHGFHMAVRARTMCQPERAVPQPESDLEDAAGADGGRQHAKRGSAGDWVDQAAGAMGVAMPVGGGADVRERVARSAFRHGPARAMHLGQLQVLRDGVSPPQPFMTH